MKATELIDELTALVREAGDVDVEAYDRHGDRGEASLEAVYVTEGRRTFYRYIIESERED